MFTGDLVTTLTWAAIGLVALLAITALLRDLLLWFWKVDQIVSLLRRQNELLAKLAGEPVEPPEQAEPQTR
jgi:hypothetical protein